MTQTVTVTDRNEVKFLIALGFSGTPSPRNSTALDFNFEATTELFAARRGYSLNQLIPVLSFIEASRFVDSAIHAHRVRGGL